jgi:hypothetical protein
LSNHYTGYCYFQALEERLTATQNNMKALDKNLADIVKTLHWLLLFSGPGGAADGHTE